MTYSIFHFEQGALTGRWETTGKFQIPDAAFDCLKYWHCIDK